MKARYMIENPGELSATLKITMKVKEWEELRDQLASTYPSWKFASAITSIITDARRIIYAPDEKEADF